MNRKECRLDRRFSSQNFVMHNLNFKTRFTYLHNYKSCKTKQCIINKYSITEHEDEIGRACGTNGGEEECL
jgi:hypothetical protein